MNFKKILLTIIVAGVCSTAIAAPKGPPVPGCWPPATCVPVNKGMVLLAAAGIGLVYMTMRKRQVVIK